MRSSPRSVADYFILFLVALAAVLSFSAPGFASAYNGHPKLIVVIVIDQFRGDYLERYRDQFGDAGFRLLLDHGAYFPNCNFNYANTRGDEMKLATQGQSRVFAVSLKDRAAVLPGGFAADAAYWIEPKTGAWVTSTYYRNELPRWVQDFNSSRPAKYWDREWKDAQGKLLGSTAHRGGKKSSDAGFYEVVG